jgi:hypothetical protein
MALNVVLICLFAVSALNVLLIYDLYNRSAKLAKYVEEAHQASLLRRSSAS